MWSGPGDEVTDMPDEDLLDEALLDAARQAGQCPWTRGVSVRCDAVAGHSGECHFPAVVTSAEVDRLRELADFARLLGPARMVLDRCAIQHPSSDTQAADMAQRIVDLIGHPVTDEPPHAMVERDEASDAVIRIGLEVEGHLDCADAQITRIVSRLEELGASGARIAG